MAVPKVVQPTPSWLKSYAVVFSSLLAGASIVHNVLKPDLTIPTLKSDNIVAQESESEALQKSEPGIADV
ncbi:unnamed protein product [Calypogeia fissa]